MVLKISPDITPNEIGNIIELVTEFRISGVIISNTTDKNRENLTGKFKNELGGLSGEPLAKISNNLIKNFYEESKGKITIIGVGGVNSGLTAYETQQIKNLYYEGDNNDTATRKAIMGALQLYGSFVMIFIFLLNLLGNRD